ncbi:hypothetical protein AVEN_274590-1 [Araneus ventricosus]|uniref:Uncharacterized protein n=1 Tax=Araneus ventricosus TaxID=182803 RepID=A0A4Y2RPI7_ARAVE|nr:hypothetical protein AVEN_274590-1 [Araneus ventricosus]
MCIGNIDKQTSKALTKAVARKMKRAACSSTFVPGPSTSGVQSTMLLKCSEDSLCDRFEESDWNEVEFERTSTPDTCKRISLSHTASAAFRTCVSERDVAIIISVLLQDARLITEEDMNLVVDMIHREKNKLGKKIQEEEYLDGLKIKSVFFDGRRDKTLFIGEKKDKRHRRQKDEEHITLLSDPGSQYLRHLTPRSGQGEEIAASLIDFLVRTKLIFLN